ncbi:MAG TPA: uracil phosphoribosyltransferase [Chthonomonadaceae bacterium]|nr:uracil phosphoribosyltransferase [Chthonomonadaceae bacterium]
MPLTVLRHSLADVLLAGLRNRDTPPERFRALTRALTNILVVEAVRDLPTAPTIVQTPLEPAAGAELRHGIVAVPILRAGLGMLDAVLEQLPKAAVGYFGLERNEETAVARSYYAKLPMVEQKTVLLLDPMLATGGSAAWAVERLAAAGPARTVLLCVVAAPEGVGLLQDRFPTLHIVAAALDRELNDRKYILPGLGDFGDRLYGTG